MKTLTPGVTCLRSGEVNMSGWSSGGATSGLEDKVESRFGFRVRLVVAGLAAFFDKKFVWRVVVSGVACTL